MRYDDPTGSDQRYFRSSERVFLLNGAWYFSAREGDQGPFASRERTVAELNRYLKLQNDGSLNAFHDALLARRRRSDADAENGSVAPDAPAPKFELVPMVAGRR